MSLEQAQKLYSEGKITEALELIDQSMPPDGDPQCGEHWALKGWCHYHRKEYQDAHYAAGKSGTEKAEGLLATMYSCVSGYTNDDSLKRLADRSPNHVAVCNALINRARAPDATVLDHDEILVRALRHRDAEVVVAHVYNNAARFFQEKARDDADLITALGLWDCALMKYGHAANFHHRAALHYWKSFVIERLFGRQAAVFTAMRACELWSQQVVLDPTNQSFQQKLAEAEKRRAALAQP